MCSNAGCFGFVGVLQWINLTGENMNNENELTAALATIEKCREITNCQAGVDIQGWLKQLAAENVEAKKIISECREYFIAGVMNRIRPTNEGYLHMICDTFADETPATDSIYAGIKADGVDYVAHKFRVRAQNSLPVGGWIDAARAAEDFAKQLREGADK